MKMYSHLMCVQKHQKCKFVPRHPKSMIAACNGGYSPVLPPLSVTQRYVALRDRERDQNWTIEANVVEYH